MWKHLKAFHRTELASLQRPSTTASQDEMDEGAESGNCPPPAKRPIQTVMHQYAIKDPYLPNSIPKKRLDNKLLKMMVKDMQPYNIVNDEGFREFVYALDPRYQLPSRSTLIRNLEEQYDTTKTSLKKKMEEADHISVTTDMWTSINTEAYLAVTAHFIIDDSLMSCLLDVHRFPQRHTADEIAAALHEIFRDFNIENKVGCVVTDNAANMVAAVKKLVLRHMPCFAHTLNLIVKDGLSAVAELTETREKVKRIVGHFKSSCVSMEKLSKYQREMKLPEYKLVQEVETRWNSTYLMLERFLAVKVPLSAALSTIDAGLPVLFSSDWDAIESAVRILHPFFQVTEEISAELNVTASKCIPMVRNLQKVTTSMMQQQEKGNIGYRLAEALNGTLQRRCSAYETSRLLSKATILDPRFKTLGFISPQKADEAVKSLSSEGAMFVLEGQAQASTPLASSTANELWHDFDTQVSSQNPRQDFLTELKLYLAEPNIVRTECPIQYWSAKEAKFHLLRELARKYLSVPATSVPSERVFSKAGELI
ncbi:hypothetical protein QQF64_019088 [Cirrhinus molitorella]|uniref:Uncharacterized protein n=1 Tax=Cirrhinus molitorella TaxID=172907 RepID=A0ABR3LI06_9TELE